MKPREKEKVWGRSGGGGDLKNCKYTEGGGGRREEEGGEGVLPEHGELLRDAKYLRLQLRDDLALCHEAQVVVVVRAYMHQYVDTCIHIHTSIYIFTHICVCVYTYACIYVHVCVYLCV